MRQFHQVGIEILGVETPQADIEAITLGHHLLSALGLADKVTLELNSLGDGESRNAYREALVAYFSAHLDKLSEDSRNRLSRNPLRILDSKDEGDRKVIANAPLLSEYLNEASRAFFAELLKGLTALGVAFTVNPRLVRGLDYYCHTAFEFTTTTLGAQGTVLAGGRYDGLIGQMGGPATAGIGWAAGVERLSLMLADVPAPPRPIAVIPVGADTAPQAMILAERLRRDGHVVELGYSGNLKKRMVRANKANARAALILGDDELARGAVMFRDLDSGEQEEIPLEKISERLKK
jgi:histidyl-tRNA synthetase